MAAPKNSTVGVDLNEFLNQDKQNEKEDLEVINEVM